MKQIHKAYRKAYKINRAVTTAQVLASGNPKRIARLATYRVGYKLFARLINGLTK